MCECVWMGGTPIQSASDKMMRHTCSNARNGTELQERAHSVQLWHNQFDLAAAECALAHTETFYLIMDHRRAQDTQDHHVGHLRLIHQW